MTDLQRILNMVVRMDAHDARKARDIFDGRLRELANFRCDIKHPDGEACETWPRTSEEFAAAQRAERDGAELPSANLPLGEHPPGSVCPPVSHRHRRDGAELQLGLEAAVRREQERLDGPDIVAHLDNSDTTVHEGARNECPACEDEGHVGQTDDLSSRILEMEERTERHARLCELRHRDDAEDIAKLQATLDRAAGEHP